MSITKEELMEFERISKKATPFEKEVLQEILNERI